MLQGRRRTWPEESRIRSDSSTPLRMCFSLSGVSEAAGRNTIMGPGIISWDFSLIKHFRFTESRWLEFRFEAFNFPNHPNWGPPNTTFVSADFGKVRSTRTSMRELQLGLKLNF